MVLILVVVFRTVTFVLMTALIPYLLEGLSLVVLQNHPVCLRLALPSTMVLTAIAKLWMGVR